MSDSSQEPLLQQLLRLDAFDQEIAFLERELKRDQESLLTAVEGAADLKAELEGVEAELLRVRAEARGAEHTVDAKRDQLDRLRSKVNQVKTEKQYGAATLEFDLVKQEIRKLEDQVLDKLQVVEDLEGRRKALQDEYDVAEAEVAPMGEEVEKRRAHLETELAIKRDRRHNIAIRLDQSVLALYQRIRGGRQEVALAPLIGEGVCGNCFTSVTIQQEMQIRGLEVIVCCEGCGVILYPENMKRAP
jgi:predicted  nucleic acid-binding Zn-ribbon protein